MEPLIAERKHQYHCTPAMAQSVLGGCPEEVWNAEFHIGKLTAYLNLQGVQLDHWVG
jgi:hypothetical protein